MVFGWFRGPFTPEELDHLQSISFFSKRDIINVYKRFRGLSKARRSDDTTKVAARVSAAQVQTMPEMRFNPFTKRLCEMFSVDGTGNLTFENFLLLFSCMSPGAHQDIKEQTAFRMYDFDNDGVLGAEDIRRTVKLLTAGRTPVDDVEVIVARVLQENDADGSGHIDFDEITKVLERSTDFLSFFSISI
jgi:Ca2+-binding EF-hand superfamily protein|eukprot:gnl/Ergobibamus_cyprinoides/1101.p1 GENE.gnl/Ergobibamus_cyprinoides/1101~~gnl/Ergobibamus_cyprinoides/1101.p1  ORF type:complete len:189 (+),score=69.73 gnl/Ergobibamus_cyprinoides/1101:112-678(+)